MEFRINKIYTNKKGGYRKVLSFQENINKGIERCMYSIVDEKGIPYGKKGDCRIEAFRKWAKEEVQK